jgi:sarcosine oxidase gamma subunit
MNFAPARWLLIGPADSWSADVSAAGALIFDTAGKWQLLEVTGPHAAVPAALDLHSTLEGRECAAAVMFDTPVVIARGAASDQLLVCVPASFAASFADSLHRWAESAT